MKSLQHIQWKRNAPDAANLTVRIIFDNLSTQCNTYWELKATDLTVIDRGNTEISGSDYANWDGNNNFPFQFIANQLGITIITNDYGNGYGGTLGSENLS